MSLNKLNSVQPYVRDRIAYILGFADYYGGRYTVTSGFRSEAAQVDLIRAGKTKTKPGCSQHQYGLAADVQFTSDVWQEWYLRAARSLGLITVSGDPVHVQAFPGSDFRAYVESLGLCGPALAVTQFIPEGPKEECIYWGGSWSHTKFGFECRGAHDANPF